MSNSYSNDTWVRHNNHGWLCILWGKLFIFYKNQWYLAGWVLIPNLMLIMFALFTWNTNSYMNKSLKFNLDELVSVYQKYNSSYSNISDVYFFVSIKVSAACELYKATEKSTWNAAILECWILKCFQAKI